VPPIKIILVALLSLAFGFMLAILADKFDIPFLF
jgi:hypothetical protein